MRSEDGAFEVLICGGGVAGLEAALALRELAGDAVAVTMLAPQANFVYRPLSVGEPFVVSSATSYPLDVLARDIGFTLLTDAFEWLDPATRTVHTHSHEAVRYDAVLLAMGARLHERFPHTMTIDDSRIDEQLHGLVLDIEGGYVKHLAFVIPSPTPWPLPIYELALMTAARAYDAQEELTITIVTPERSPLAVFGPEASDAVAALLEESGIEVLTSCTCEVRAPGMLTIHPAQRERHFDRIVALPELFGPSTPGVPGGPAGGFIPIDSHCAVKGLDRVYAAGDATNYPVKLGGVAAQQADAAAAAIASLAGAPVEPEPLRPSIHGILLGGRRPLYLSADVVGAVSVNSKVSEVPLWPAERKIVARYLAPYLESHDHMASRR